MLAGTLMLLLLEPDVGSSIVMVGIFVSAYWAAGGRLRHLMLLAGALGLAFLAVTLLEPYRMGRLTAFRNPWADPLGAGFQATQSLYGLASGGFFGVGIGHSIEKYGWLPEAHTDFIFAIVGEETGLVGTSLILLGFAAFAVRGYRAAMRAPDRLGLALATAITTGITFQALVNMATVTDTLPITGVPLPLISYGGSSIAMTLAAIGVLLNIASQGTRQRLATARETDWESQAGEVADLGRRNERSRDAGPGRRPGFSR